MRSLILTLLYLAKDTLHRWCTRISSPLARMLVVFFLSLCALVFLGTYVVSTKHIRDRIRNQGADTVTFLVPDASQLSFPTAEEIKKILNADSITLRSVGNAQDGRSRSYPIYTYDFARSNQFFPLLAAGGLPTLLCTSDSDIPLGPRTVRVASTEQLVLVRYLPSDHQLMRLQGNAFILVQPEVVENLTGKRSFGSLHAQLRLSEEEITIERLQELEKYLRTLAQLEGKMCHVTSASRLLGDMDNILGNQGQARASFCLGIGCIVGILLTSLSGMEFRQNEYIYTLMKSFGIHPLMLVLAFIIENTILIGLSFIAAVLVFLETQKIILTQYFKMGQYSLSLKEIQPEIELITLTLGACVLISAIPIVIAAYKEIGRILK